MKRKASVLLQILILALICTVVIAAMSFMYSSSDYFRSLFSSSSSAVLGDVSGEDGGQTLADRARFAGVLSMYICSSILAMQMCAFYYGIHVIRSISKLAEAVDIKMKKFKNAEIFLDLPLYIGLFGTVSSFLVLSYSPTSGRLIAYSSTLVGIIASVIMRVVLLYPVRNRMIDLEAEVENQKR